MTTNTVRTAWAKIFIAGPIEIAKQICREECLREGLCVTVDPTSYIYTGGEEEGVVIGFINYPRFPSNEFMLYNRACALAQLLIKEMGQTSASVMTSYRTTWFSNREE